MNLQEGATVKTDKRTFQRYLVQDLAFAVFRPQFTKLGKVRDISRSGLSFEYVTSEGRKEDSLEMDIFISGARFHLANLPVKTIYDSKVGGDKYSLTPFVERRRCGVEIGELTDTQRSQLEYFIHNFGTGKLP
jgi:hypothetical protein